MILASPDLHRIMALPERDPPAPDTWYLPQDGAPKTCKCAAMNRQCLSMLYGAQRAALEEMQASRGLFGMLAVGSGKSALGVLGPAALERAITVMLLPSGQVEQMAEELAWVGQHMRVPRLYIIDNGGREPRLVPDVDGTDPTLILYLLAYSKLSRQESTDLLERLAPTFIIADEAHKLRHRVTSTTRRVLRYLAAHDDCAFACWSGTLTSRSLRDFAHLLAFALREGSPLPLDPMVVDQWADAFDAGQDADRQVGAFAKFLQPGEDPREGLRRRMFRTAGVIGSVSSAAEDLPALNFEIEKMELGVKIRDALAKLKELWVLPNGEELTLATEIWQAKTELLCGFHYKWDWTAARSAGATDAQRAEWVNARAEWHREVRGRLSARSRPGFDSPALIEQGMLGRLIPSSERFERWNSVRSNVPAPVTVPVWIDDSWIDEIVELAEERRALVWFTHDAVGRKLGDQLPLYQEAEGMVADLRAKGAPAAALSIKACGQGVDGLQRMYSEQIVVCPYSSGEGWEQLLGRLHRKGQEQDIRTTVFERDLEFLKDARERCSYVRRTMGLEQKLILARGLENLEVLAAQVQLRTAQAAN